MFMTIRSFVCAAWAGAAAGACAAGIGTAGAGPATTGAGIAGMAGMVGTGGMAGGGRPARLPSFAMRAAREEAFMVTPESPPSSRRQLPFPETAASAAEAVPAGPSPTKFILRGWPRTSTPFIPSSASSAVLASLKVTKACPRLTPTSLRCTSALSTSPKGAKSRRRSASAMVLLRFPTYSRRRSRLFPPPVFFASSASRLATKFFSASEALTTMENFWKSGTTSCSISTLGTSSRSSISTYAKPLWRPFLSRIMITFRTLPTFSKYFLITVSSAFFTS
mmetsp:Transcript_1250/g.5349  ORF Transcript_1250/g.5349 Transcript_1250/m.5349 type:complete len:279 (-) Transcript_1250:909-1745(-)